MQMPNQLVQIITEPYQLTVDELLMIILRPPLRSTALLLLQKQRAPELRCAHAECRGAPFDTRQLRRGETEVELMATRFVYCGSAHGFLPWQSACVLGIGGQALPAPNETFCP